MTWLFNFTEQHPFVILGIIVVFLFILGFRKYVFKFLQEHIIAIIILIVIVFCAWFAISETISSNREEEQEALLEQARSDLYGTFEDYDYKDSEIPYVYASGWIDDNSIQELSVYVRLYDKFDSYTKDEQILLIHKYNQYFTKKFTNLVYISDYYQYLTEDYTINIEYETNDKNYEEYTYEHTVEIE